MSGMGAACCMNLAWGVIVAQSIFGLLSPGTVSISIYTIKVAMYVIRVLARLDWPSHLVDHGGCR